MRTTTFRTVAVAVMSFFFNEKVVALLAELPMFTTEVKLALAAFSPVWM